VTRNSSPAELIPSAQVTSTTGLVSLTAGATSSDEDSTPGASSAGEAVTSLPFASSEAGSSEAASGGVAAGRRERRADWRSETRDWGTNWGRFGGSESELIVMNTKKEMEDGGRG
jgi:hypothetical protein